MSDAIKLDNVKKAISEINRLIDRKRKQAIRYRHSGDEKQALYFNAEANGLGIAKLKILRAMEE